MSIRLLNRETRRFNGEVVHSATLPNGLPIMVVPKKGFRRSYGLMGINFGSIDNEFQTSLRPGGISRVPDGVAHFLEHKMFEKEDGDVMERFQAMGVSSNAQTGFNHTGYLFETTGAISAPLELLVDFVTRPYFRENLVEKEKGIIEEEIKMYLDDPGWRGFMGVLEDLYPGHPLSIDIAGSVESIHQIKKADLDLCYEAFYHPKNMHLVVCGDVELKEVAEIAERVLNKNERPWPEETERVRTAVKGRPKTRRREISAPVSHQKLFLGYRVDTEVLDDIDPIDLEIALDVFLGAVFSRSGELYQTLYRRGLADDSFGYSCYTEREYAFLMIQADSSDVVKLDREVSRAFLKRVDEGLTAAELRRQRRKKYGDFVGSLDSVSATSWNLVECHVKGVSFADYGDRLAKLSAKRIHEIVKRAFRKDRACAHYLMPQASTAGSAPASTSTSTGS